MSKLAEYLAAQVGVNGSDRAGSGATSPGAEWRDGDDLESRYRPRTYPYFKHLPYPVEEEAERLSNLEDILKELYIAVRAGDFAAGAVRWTRELRNWMALKFDLPRITRGKLVQLYYGLALAPGLEPSTSERFASMFMVLTKRKHYLNPGKDLILDWRPLYKELKTFVLPQAPSYVQQSGSRRSVRILMKMCGFAQYYFDPDEKLAMLEEFLPYFSTSNIEGAFVVVGLLNLLLPSSPSGPTNPKQKPAYFLPSLFGIWSLVNRSRSVDSNFLDLLSRLARDMLRASNVPFGPYGVFSAEQSSLIFTAIIRLLDIPVGQASSPYSNSVDMGAGLALFLDRDARKSPVTYHIARWTVMSLSPKCMDTKDSVLARLEGLLQSVETFFHPSLQGAWTKGLSQLVFYLADFFVMRWNRECSGEMDVPEDRRLTPELKRRFVLCLRDVTFMGIYSKSSTAMNLSLSSLQSLACLEPSLILPGALQRIYPSMQGLVEVHRTTSSLKSLQVLARTLSSTKGFRLHVTALLGLAIPGIDANDLDKTLHTLSFIQAVAYNVRFTDLTREHGSGASSQLAVEWVTGEVDRLERAGADVVLDYETELSSEYEEAVLVSSTAGFGEFLISFLGRVFTLLENLPDASRARSGPEEHVMNTLPAAFTPLLASLSPELYDIALQKITDFVGNHVIHQARDAMAFICNSLCKINPKKALKSLLPVLISNIYTEINENGAASTRNTGTDPLPRDRGLVWNICLLSMCVVHVGSDVLTHKDSLVEVAVFMQERCKGIPTVHVSNFIHHLLLNLTVTYTIDYALEEPKIVNGQDDHPACWGGFTDPKEMTIDWHTPKRPGIEFAVQVFEHHTEKALRTLIMLTGPNSEIPCDGTGKEWSDEVTRNLVLLRLLISGVSVLFDPKYVPQGQAAEGVSEADLSDEPIVEQPDEDHKPSFRYSAGYFFEKPDDPLYKKVHNLRDRIGETLHQVHEFLSTGQEDDVACFTALYSAYRSWFVDVGLERSAHTLDRVARLLVSDCQNFKVSGLRKQYPRPLLVRRANLYHLQRLRHNANMRPQSQLDRVLLLDLAHSCVSLYTDIRKHAQSAGENATKCILRSRALIIPPLLEAFEKSVKAKDYPRMKGSMYSLLFGNLAKTVGRDWRFTPTLIKAFIAASTADKPSVQKLANHAVYHVMDFGRSVETTVIVDEDTVKSIAPQESVGEQILKTQNKLQKRKEKVEGKKSELALDLVHLAKHSHWKTSQRAATLLVNLGLRFTTIAPTSFIELVTTGTIDSHPSLRGLYSGCLVALFCLIELRVMSEHDVLNFLADRLAVPHRTLIRAKRDDPTWTADFLKAFSRPEADYFVDHDYPGWLVWPVEFPAYVREAQRKTKHDEVELDAKRTIAKAMDRAWFKAFFGYLKQEPRDGGIDRFRMSSSLLLQFAFELTRDGISTVSFEEIQEEVKDVLEDGADKHQHRATAEILGALVCSYMDSPEAERQKMWDYVLPMVTDVVEKTLTPENLSYWISFLRLVTRSTDPRRAWPLIEWMSSFRLDMASNAAFKESSKLQLLQQCITETGWHFRLEAPILEDLLLHLDHPYKGVREAMGGTIGVIYRTRHYLSYKDVPALMEAQVQASPAGTQPYKPSEAFAATIKDVFARLERWRHERTPGQQTPSAYTSASKTVLMWLETTLTSFECTQLVPFFPIFMPELLHMMDIKEDPELMSLAYHVFKHLANVPHPFTGDHGFIDALIEIGTGSSFWHQRLRILLNIQVYYFRRLFLISGDETARLFATVSGMLEDPQFDVRNAAESTLSGMIRCSPVRVRDALVNDLKDKFTTMLAANPLPRREPAGTPTPDFNKILLIRHAAVLGLGALVKAFPYASPPPLWLPEVLATLANRAAADPGVVGKSVKSALSEFKKTRQDTWHVDVKAFSTEQLEDLEGVLWKSYFA